MEWLETDLYQRLIHSGLTTVSLQKFEPDKVFAFSTPTATVVEALAAPKPVLYVRVSNDPFEDLR